MLQNSDKYSYRLITKEEKEVTETPTPMPATPTPTSAAAQASDAPQESQPEQTAAAPEDSKKEVSLDDLDHLKGVSILYTSYRLADKYGSSQIRAEQGKKMCIRDSGMILQLDYEVSKIGVTSIEILVEGKNFLTGGSGSVTV